MSSSLTVVPPPPSSVQIAHAFDLLAAANQWLFEELKWLADCENPLSQVSVDRLTALGRRMQRDSCQARAQQLWAAGAAL